ncbi:MAG: hypothetical protein F4Y35_08415 [Chloroflexi bacterium]|nr:hypothetical protein [Chloroflexota bacterium]
MRHAGVAPIVEAQAVLNDFSPPSSAPFWLQSGQSEPAYRPLEPALDLGVVLAFRHSRTVAPSLPLA